MLTYPSINHEVISLGPLSVHWYGIMYLVGFTGGWWLARRRAALPESGWSRQQMDDLLFYVVLGVILGGRIGYTLFYGMEYFYLIPSPCFVSGKGDVVPWRTAGCIDCDVVLRQTPFPPIFSADGFFGTANSGRPWYRSLG